MAAVVALAACGDRYDSITPETATPSTPTPGTPSPDAPATPSTATPGTATPGDAPSAGASGSGSEPAGAEGTPVVGGIDTSGEAGGSGEGAAPSDEQTPPGDMTATPEQPPVAPVDGPIVRPEAPCDIYAAANTPCVGAYSMVRALTSTYAGPLYQLRRGAPNALQNTGNGGQTQDIGVLPNGFADDAAHAAFCGNQTCTISIVYDQSTQGNNLTVAKAGCYTGTASEDDWESTAVPLTVGGNDVRGLFMEAHEGYRNNDAVNTPEGQDEAGVYMLAAGTGSRPLPPSGCCWNFGIASRDNCYGPTGMMHALFLGTAYWGRGAGSGPWFMGDFEAGVWAGGTRGRIDGSEPYDTNQNSPSMTMNFAFGVLKSRPNNYALRMGNGQQGNLTTAYDGPTPTAMNGSWKMEGGIVLGIGGDNSNSSAGGTFFEGAIIAGRPSDATDEAVLRNVQAAGYGQ
ncbi:MAG TPA: arabinofuranosidase catalytic domain-containing protein [Polyangiaceae bacterium]|nr:arabinofuranosidase catalytic domain-containing protein [Polyangiaceae bacterium]